VRERVQRPTCAERSQSERGRERTPSIPAAVLALQRSAGNAATARLLQRAPHHTGYAPAARDAIAPEFRTNHIGRDEDDAINQHANRGTYTTNTFVDMTDDDAAEEIFRYLSGLPVSTDISNWDGFTFVTQSGYWCYETTLVDNNTGAYRVRKVFATVRVRAWWNQQLGVFRIGHMYGIAAPVHGTDHTSYRQMVA
jgi:hypothetical protein